MNINSILELKLIFANLLVYIYFITTKCDCRMYTNDCGEFGNRIINGQNAGDKKFPYQVSLQKYNRHHCGGSIITEIKVLTAGHCVTDNYGYPSRKEYFRILAGSNYLDNENPENYYSIQHITIHPKFDRGAVRYDYAIIFINGKFNSNDTNISSIPLAYKKSRPGELCYLSGWGNIKPKGKKIKIPNELQYAIISINSPEVCRKLFRYTFNSEHMICAAHTNKANAGCGDSGGPLVCNSFLTGVVSYGSLHYDPSYPDVYSSAYYASDWIMRTNGDNKSVHSRIGSITIFSTIFILHAKIINKILI